MSKLTVVLNSGRTAEEDRAWLEDVLIHALESKGETWQPEVYLGRYVQRGGHGFDIRLHRMENSERVLWYKDNSYVSDGKDVYSINGIGEIRWKVEPWDDKEEREVTRKYFGLPPMERER